MRDIIQSKKMNYIAYVRNGNYIDGYAYKDRSMHIKYGNRKIISGLWSTSRTNLSDDNEYMELVAAGSLIEFGQRPHLQLDAANTETTDLKKQLTVANAETADLKKQLTVANAGIVDIMKIISTILNGNMKMI